MFKYTIPVIAFLLISIGGLAQKTFVVQTDKHGATIQSTMWGIFFEDINFAADGGLYAELVKNRSFEFADPLMGWRQKNTNKYALTTNAGVLQIINEGQSNNHRIARVTVQKDHGYSLINDGFNGMGVKAGAEYEFSIIAKHQDGVTSLHVALVDSTGQELGAVAISPQGKEWKKYTAKFKCNRTSLKASLEIRFDGTGTNDIDVVSLFPTDTWKNRPGGLRKDLVQLLADLTPGFIRFPGGCIVEGRELTTRYQWKKTIGEIDQREVIVNRWNTEFGHRPAPDYFQTFGLGFFEYFQLAEDLGAEPLPILNCGMACQFNTNEVAPIEQLDPYVQDALDLIEFANGDAGTKWGKLRIGLGHPAAFNLKFIGVGNEQWGPEYIERYKVFAAALKAKYPTVQIIAAAGPAPAGELFDFASKELKALRADLIDEHYYNKPEWFLSNASRYDTYDRSGPKIFAGEYAAQSVATVSPKNENNWRTALAEAAFMTGLERNADIVHMASYAPLFAHVDRWQWTPDLIWFDNLNSYGTPNYYVQKLFSNNRGTVTLPITSGGKSVSGDEELYASAVADEKGKKIIIKIVNAGSSAQPIFLELKGVGKVASRGGMIVLKGDEHDMNSLTSPTGIHPIEQAITLKGKDLRLTLPQKSLSIVIIPSH